MYKCNSAYGIHTDFTTQAHRNHEKDQNELEMNKENAHTHTHIHAGKTNWNVKIYNWILISKLCLRVSQIRI